MIFPPSRQEGCEGTENRLILHILTRPLCLFILAVFSSVLRCLVHSFILALAIPVFLLIVFLKITMPRSTGVLGSSRPYWDYVGSCHRGTQDETLQNPYARISGKTPVTRRVSLLKFIRFGDKIMQPNDHNLLFFQLAKAQNWHKRKGERGVDREDHPREGTGCGSGVGGGLRRRHHRLHFPGESDPGRLQEGLQAGDRQLVPQGGPGPAASPESGTETEGG